MIDEFFFDRVLVEPGDGAQAPGDGRAGPAPGFQFPGEGLEVGAADGEQGQGTGAAPGGELAQVERVSLSCQAAVPGQEPGEGEPFGVGEDGLDRGERFATAPRREAADCSGRRRLPPDRQRASG